MDELREKLADSAHTSWAGWIRYMFSRCEEYVDNDGLHIPKSLVDRWFRQMNTPYSELPESEKESDREEADRVLAVLRGHAVIP